MHIVSDKSLERPGYVYRNGVGVPDSWRPHINVNHRDGPLLYFRDGQLHWLTIWERIQFRFGWTDAMDLERKRRPDLAVTNGEREGA